MSIVNINRTGDLYHLKTQRRNADREAFIFGRKGEFSPNSDFAFKKHLNKLNKIKNEPYIQNLNGTKYKTIRKLEGFWY